MTERAPVAALVTEARVQLRVKKDRAHALELVAAADARLAGLDADGADIYASVASLWLELGDELRSEHRITQAIRSGEQATPVQPVILGTHKLFYAKLLRAQQRFGDAARQAGEGVAIYARGVDPESPELARLRAFFEPFLAHTVTPDPRSVVGGLQAMAVRLCSVATGSAAEIHSALGIPTNPPPLGASECLVDAGELSMASVELRFPAGTLTRRDLDDTFGPPNVLPRTGAFASHVLNYDLRTPGTPARISLFARFADDPTASAKSVLLRIDRA
ncbi:hypothetical protein DFJ67_2422 [Asanoa ferruginea]|uniref:Uncharacterized protein n=1 Tax=Asanoa ferruginea TaxID=53367 RepID=A0A3D9ZRX9_9ACTN|nr:hypothetical protein [Asanoa ferruginea]REF96440.1 hypothetical protein DFJ67_2422 [Asanoa ferruginea]GIF50337.1 hypothetical protein Afe04nite_48760 [Asanoa ferruginea]